MAICKMQVAVTDIKDLNKGHIRLAGNKEHLEWSLKIRILKGYRAGQSFRRW